MLTGLPRPTDVSAAMGLTASGVGPDGASGGVSAAQNQFSLLGFIREGLRTPSEPSKIPA